MFLVLRVGTTKVQAMFSPILSKVTLRSTCYWYWMWRWRTESFAILLSFPSSTETRGKEYLWLENFPYLLHNQNYLFSFKNKFHSEALLYYILSLGWEVSCCYKRYFTVRFDFDWLSSSVWTKSWYSSCLSRMPSSDKWKLCVQLSIMWATIVF